MEVQKRMDNILKDIKQLVEDIQKDNLQNEQFTLDFMDELNKLSVSF